MNDLDTLLLSVIPRANFTRISKEDLLKYLKGRNFIISDRGLRSTIEALRRTPEGSMICSSLSGGYFIATDLDELKKAIGSDERRAIKILSRCRAQRKNAKLEMNPEVKAEMESQKEMFETVGSQLVLMAQGQVDPVSYLRPDGKRKS